ncbi:MAG: glycosyltransferase family 2 protein [Pseudomonadales bacterium]|nr:glycosyltransferase family 2 protein [Pseudomonadales bacterium]
MARPLPEASFLVPCFNDAATVIDSIESLLKVLGPDADIVVIDDASTDESVALLEVHAGRMPYRLLRNDSNQGKSWTLDHAYRLARHDILVFVDADVTVDAPALRDVLERLRDPRVGAVSCPYVPRNTGIIPLMLHVEYNMLSLVQGAYNLASAMSLWGGFLAVKRAAFEQAGGFSLDAITEDMDLAFKLNRCGWKVEQSFVPVRTIVPETLGAWFRQKLRWYQGGLQASLRHWRVWITNPIHLLFMSSMATFIALSIVSLGQQVATLQNVVDYLGLLGETLSLLASLKAVGLVYGATLLKDALWGLAFTLVCIPYVLPMITSLRKAHLALLVAPFAMVYMPASLVVLVCAAAVLAVHARHLRPGVRAW